MRPGAAGERNGAAMPRHDAEALNEVPPRDRRAPAVFARTPSSLPCKAGNHVRASTRRAGDTHAPRGGTRLRVQAICRDAVPGPDGSDARGAGRQSSRHATRREAAVREPRSSEEIRVPSLQSRRIPQSNAQEMVARTRREPCLQMIKRCVRAAICESHRASKERYRIVPSALQGLGSSTQWYADRLLVT